MARLNELQVLVTADEAFGVFDEAVANAQDRIDMGFRVFDPRTLLRSDAARAYGETWANLLCAKLDEGVRISLVLTDFDPIARPWMHAASWKSYSIFAGIAEITKNPELLSMRVSDHPARVGWGPRLALWPKVQAEMQKTCDALEEMTDTARAEALRLMPGVRPLLDETGGKPVRDRKQLPALMPVTHHQKVAVIDDAYLYIGGLDLDQRRFDGIDHDRPAEDTWHDVHLMVHEPQLALSARQHLERFEAEVRGDRPLQEPPGLLRTLSQKRAREAVALSPQIEETGLLDRHLSRIKQAKELIYLESQFLRDPTLVDALVAQSVEEPHLGLICLLPAAPLEVAFEDAFGLDMKYGEYMQAQSLDRLVDAFGDRLVIVSPAQKRSSDATGRSTLNGAPMIFVHSKVSIFDDTAAIVSSANLNGRSLRWDTELGLEIDDPAQVSETRTRVMRAWLPEGAAPDMTAPKLETVAAWRRLASKNASRAPADREGFLLPYDISAARAFGKPMPGLPSEMV